MDQLAENMLWSPFPSQQKETKVCSQKCVGEKRERELIRWIEVERNNVSVFCVGSYGEKHLGHHNLNNWLHLMNSLFSASSIWAVEVTSPRPVGVRTAPLKRSWMFSPANLAKPCLPPGPDKKGQGKKKNRLRQRIQGRISTNSRREDIKEQVYSGQVSSSTCKLRFSLTDCQHHHFLFSLLPFLSHSLGLLSHLH